MAIMVWRYLSLAGIAMQAALLPVPSSAETAIEPVAVVQHYADMAAAIYTDAWQSAQQLQQAVNQLTAQPSAATLQQARQAWKLARVSYLHSEVFRFGNPVVDAWEGRVNAWPLDEGLIDYVDTSRYQAADDNPGAQANIIAGGSLNLGDERVDLTAITPQLLQRLHEWGGSEANVATGYHAIEFLLWGQDLHGSAPGAGQRPYTDFVLGPGCTQGHCQRRGQYLRAATELLVADLHEMVQHWQPGDPHNYRAQLLALPPAQGLQRMLQGMGNLLLGELAGERMKVALQAHSMEDEQDCFSDNTHYAHFYNGQGVDAIFYGRYERLDRSVLRGPSLYHLLKQRNAESAQALAQTFYISQMALQRLVDSAEKQQVYFDQLIAKDNAPGHQLVEQAIDALVQQTQQLERATGYLVSQP